MKTDCVFKIFRTFVFVFSLSNKGLIPIENLNRLVKERQCGMWKKKKKINVVYMEMIDQDNVLYRAFVMSPSNILISAVHD